MKLMMFEKGKGAALGLVEGKTVIDLSACRCVAAEGPEGLIAAGPRALAAAKAAAAKAPASAKLALDAVKPALPIDPSGKIICVGLNYALHAKEGGHAIPTYPSFFLRVPTSLVAAGAPVIRPKCSDPARLRVRAHHRHRQGRPAHPRGQGARARVRLHALQRRLRARLPAQDLAVDAGQELRRHRPARPLGRHRRRAAAGRLGPAHHDARQRRDHAGFQHLRHDLLHRQDHRAAVRSS